MTAGTIVLEVVRGRSNAPAPESDWIGVEPMPKRIPDDDAVAVMRAAGLEPLVTYPGARSRWACICTICGRASEPLYMHVVRGLSGCRPCRLEAKAAASRTASNPVWKGDGVEYAAVHKRLGAMRGKASAHACVDCGGRAADWSYVGGSDKEMVSAARHSAGMVYSTEISDYVPRCASCHKRHDLGVRRGS